MNKDIAKILADEVLNGEICEMLHLAREPIDAPITTALLNSFKVELNRFRADDREIKGYYFNDNPKRRNTIFLFLYQIVAYAVFLSAIISFQGLTPGAWVIIGMMIFTFIAVAVLYVYNMAVRKALLVTQFEIGNGKFRVFYAKLCIDHNIRPSDYEIDLDAAVAFYDDYLYGKVTDEKAVFSFFTDLLEKAPLKEK